MPPPISPPASPPPGPSRPTPLTHLLASSSDHSTLMTSSPAVTLPPSLAPSNPGLLRPDADGPPPRRRPRPFAAAFIACSSSSLRTWTCVGGGGQGGVDVRSSVPATPYAHLFSIHLRGQSGRVFLCLLHQEDKLLVHSFSTYGVHIDLLFVRHDFVDFEPEPSDVARQLAGRPFQLVLAGVGS